MDFILKSGPMFIAILFFLFPTHGFPEDSASALVYSIHVASYQRVGDAEKKMDSLKNRGLGAFRKSRGDTAAPLIHSVYLGSYDTLREAVLYWKTLNRAGLLDHLEIHLFNIMEATEKGLKQVKTRPPLAGTALQPQPPIEKKNRFIDNKDGSVTDRVTNLMWMKKGRRLASFAAVNWWDAIKQTKGIRMGGHEDWRLPTIEEWRSLLNRKRQFPALIEPNPFKNIITHMPYWTRTEFTYGKKYSCNKICPLEAYAVMLYSGSISHQKKSDRAFVMAVRSME